MVMIISGLYIHTCNTEKEQVKKKNNKIVFPASIETRQNIELAVDDRRPMR